MKYVTKAENCSPFFIGNSMGPHHLVVCSQGHEIGHVNFIEGGQHCKGVLRALEALCHARAQPRHLHTSAHGADSAISHGNNFLRCVMLLLPDASQSLGSWLLKPVSELR